MTATSQKIFPICKNFIAAMALPVIVAMLGMTSASAGAIFTTDVDCNKVNGNIYADKADVYLNGGPDGKGSALEANTEYCVRVSAPGGIPDLNAQECRVTTDENGHFSCFNLFECTGFADTDNPGGEYKVEVCPVDSAVCVFRSDNRCKSDNFKVRSSVHCPPGQEVCISCPVDIEVPCTERTFGSCTKVEWEPPIVIGGSGTATCDPPSGSEFCVGEHTVTCTVDGTKTETNPDGVFCSFKVTVDACPQECLLDPLPPVSVCSCLGPKVVNYTAPATLTDGNGVSFTLVANSCTPASGSTFAVGSTPVLCTYKDAADDECPTGFSVTVTEDAGPKITCPKDVELQCGDSTAPSNTGCATAIGDACGGKVTITYTDKATAASCTGKAGIDRTWTATDECTKTGSCVQHITFVDKTAPTITCPKGPITANTCAPANCAAVSFTVTATDNCGGKATVVCTDKSGNVVQSGGCFPVGTTEVSCTASDACLNQSSPCNFTITVNSSICGGLTMGFWQNKNGQGIISNCSGTGLRTFLRGFLPFQDLSATATPAQVATYVYNLIKAANASGTSMNPMLKAQMLATALDVYFSNPALGGNKINAPTPIGGLSVDLTKVCKMIDSTAGTATCSGIYQNVSAAFGGANCLTVSQALTCAASKSNADGSVWYGQVKTTQELAKNTFDAINNGVALACP